LARIAAPTSEAGADVVKTIPFFDGTGGGASAAARQADGDTDGETDRDDWANVIHDVLVGLLLDRAVRRREQMWGEAIAPPSRRQRSINTFRTPPVFAPLCRKRGRRLMFLPSYVSYRQGAVLCPRAVVRS